MQMAPKKLATKRARKTVAGKDLAQLHLQILNLMNINFAARSINAILG